MISLARAGPGVVDPVVEASTLERIVEVAGAVRRQHDDRRVLGALRAELGDRHRRLRQELEQERLELVVGAVDLVDQQHRRPRAGMPQRAQQRSFDEELGSEQIDVVERLATGLGEADAEQLTGVVPLVQRLGRVDALVALQSHEPRVEGRGERLGRGRLADPGFAFEEQRLGEPGGAEERGRQSLVGEVGVVGEAPAE